MGIGQVLKEAVVSFVDGFKSRVNDKGTDNSENVSLFNNSDTDASANDINAILDDYSQYQSAVGHTDVKKQILEQQESEIMLDLYEMLEETSDNEKKKQIEDKIRSKQCIFSAEKTILENEDVIQKSNLTDEQKTELQNLYNKAARCEDKDRQEALKAEIDAFYKNEGIDDIDLKYMLDRNLLLAQRDIDLSKELEKLSTIDDSDQREQVNAVISKKQEEHETKLAQLSLETGINSLEINEETKTELLNLYNELSTTSDFEKNTEIEAKMNEILENSNIPKEFQTRMALDISTIKYAKELAGEYEKLSEITDNDQKEQIWNNINKLYETRNYEQTKLHLEASIETSNLTTEQKAELTRLYDLLDRAVNSDNRDIVKESIDDFMNAYGIDKNDPTILRIISQGLELDFHRDRQDLQEKIKNCENQDQREQLQAKISQIQSEWLVENANIYAKIGIQDSNLSKETKGELIELYDKLKDTTDGAELERITKEISQILDNNELSADAKYYLNHDMVKIIEENELADKYEKLSNITDSDQKEIINRELSSIVQKHSKQFDKLTYELAKDKYTLEDTSGITVDKTQTQEDKEFNKIAKTIKQMGFSIPKDIKDVDGLRDYLDEIQKVIEENTEDDYGSFG